MFIAICFFRDYLLRILGFVTLNLVYQQRPSVPTFEAKNEEFKKTLEIVDERT
jgi:hypothetical protein